MTDGIIKILDDLAERFGIVVDWASEDVMPVIMEILGRLRIYEIIMSSIGVVVPIILTLIIVIILIVLLKKNVGRDIIEIFQYLTLIIVIISIILICFNLPSLIKWIVVPEVEYIKYIKGLM